MIIISLTIVVIFNHKKRKKQLNTQKWNYEQNLEDNKRKTIETKTRKHRK